ncbi:MAG: hypothetical protein AAF191_08135, partial [Verrucomicrobiota bacterium]
MKFSLQSLLIISSMLMPLPMVSAADNAAEWNGDHVIADFEQETPLKGNNATHKATVTKVEDVPQGGGQFAAKTLVDPAVGASRFFGTGFKVPESDLSRFDEVRFWIKTDIVSQFNLQIHSSDQGTSVFPFSTIDTEPETWQQISAPLASFRLPPWAKTKANLKHLDKIQLTAYGSGPYEGTYLILDQVIATSASS